MTTNRMTPSAWYLVLGIVALCMFAIGAQVMASTHQCPVDVMGNAQIKLLEEQIKEAHMENDRLRDYLIRITIGEGELPPIEALND